MALTVDPAVLSAAAASLTGFSTTLAADEAGIAPATTVIAPAGTDSVSIQQAAIFSAFGTELQTVLAQGQDYATQFETNLANASDTYQFTEASNAASATASSAASSGGGAGSALNGLSYLLGGPETSSAPGLGGALGLSGNTANLFNIGGGNWASAASDLLGLAGGGLLDTSGTAAGAGLAADVASSPGLGAAGAMVGMGGMPAASMGSATMVNKLSVPATWAESAVPVASPVAAIQTAGWTAAAPQAGVGTVIPGMPGMGGAGRNAAGFGAPRYGVKPIVMPKPTAV